MPGLSDYVIMVRGRARAFLAGPPLLKAATGEIATDEELGGAEMHAQRLRAGRVPGRGRRAARSRLARELVGAARLAAATRRWPDGAEPPLLRRRRPARPLRAPTCAKPVDMREVIARIVDGSDFLEFKADYGAGHRLRPRRASPAIAVGIVTNNGPLDAAGATKATHFIQCCCQLGIADRLPAEHHRLHGRHRGASSAGMIKHGSKMIQARGQRHGAADHHPVRRLVRRRQLRHVRPRLRAALRLQLADRDDRGDGRRAGRAARWRSSCRSGAGAQGRARSTRRSSQAQMRRRSSATFERQADAFYTSGLLLDDGVIDPRDTRARARALPRRSATRRRGARCSPMQFGVARPVAVADQETAMQLHPRTPTRSRSTLKRFIDEEINPHVDEWEAAEVFPAHEVFKRPRRARPARPDQARGVRRHGARLLVLGGDGRGARPRRTAAACRWRSACRPTWRRRRSRASAATSCSREFLAPAIAGDAVGCIGVASPAPAPTSRASRRRARRTATTTSSTAQKMWITNSLQADWMCLLANTGEGAAHKNKSLIMVPMRDAKGVDRGAQKISKIGMNVERHRPDPLRRRARAAAQPHRRGRHGLHLPDACSSRRSACGPRRAAIQSLANCIDQTIDYARERQHLRRRACSTTSGCTSSSPS